MKFKLKIGSQEEMFELARRGETFYLTRGGQTVEVLLVHQEGATAVLEYTPPGSNLRRRLRVAGYQDGDRRQLWLDGRTLTARRVRDKATSAGAPVDASLAAAIPAVVAQVLVQPGDRVAAGDRLLLLESMKMVMPILAPHDGLVKKLNCTAGQAVQPGIPLVELAKL